jgi:hypothetical protein
VIDKGKMSLFLLYLLSVVLEAAGDLEATGIANAPSIVYSLSIDSSDTDITVFNVQDNIDPIYQCNSFCDQYQLSVELCDELKIDMQATLLASGIVTAKAPDTVEVSASASNIIESDDDSDDFNLIASIPVRLTHLSDNLATTKLLIYAGRDAAVQAQLYCSKYELSDVNCEILTNVAVVAELEYFQDLYERDHHQYHLLQSSYKVNPSSTEHLPETIQLCVSKDKTCRFTHLYYDVIDEIFFINNCHPMISPVGQILRQRFSLGGRDGTYDSVAAKVDSSNNFATRCLLDIDPAPDVVNAYVNKTVIIARRHSPWNAGHVMIETAIPIEKLAGSYGVNDIGSRVIVFDDDCFDSYSINWYEFKNSKNEKLCDLYTNQFVSPLSNNPLQSHHDLKTLAEEKRFIHFQDVLVGIGESSPFHKVWEQDWMGSSVERFRQNIFRSMGVDENTNNNQKLLTLIYKIGKRSVINLEDKTQFLQSWCLVNNYRFISINLASATFESQVQIIANSDILLSPGGSAAFSSLFLKPNASFIYFPLLGLDSASGKPYVNNNLEVLTIFEHISFFKLYEYIKWDTELLERRWVDVSQSDFSFNVDLAVLGHILLHMITEEGMHS